MREGLSVPELLQRGAAAPAHVDPVIAVMGEIRLRPGKGGTLHLGNAALRRDARRRRAIAGALAPNPQALVKLIGSGGAKSAGGLRTQMDYLSREGAVPLRSSESSFGAELTAESIRDLAGAWGLPAQDRGGSDRTSHFVVSFPQGTDPDAAERAGRAWAAALFDSGAHGDRWDYYTAFHKDTAYPHIHVVVGRRGLDEGQWLRVSSRGAITFDRLREVQVEVAAREGIALTGTTRLSRGVHDRPVPDGEYRRARAEGRAAVAPAHSEISAVLTAAEILDHARDYQGAAAAIADQAPELARRLEAAAATILAGRAIAADAAAELTPREAMRMVETIKQIQTEVQQNFVKLEADIRSVENPGKRAEFLRDLAGLKAEAAPFIRDDVGLQGYRAEALHADHRGLVAPEGDGRAATIKSEADRAAARLGERFGLQPAATLARFSAEAVSIGLGRDYRAEELAERASDRAARGQPAERVDEATVQIAEFHRRAAVIYREAAERLREIEREDPRGVPEIGSTRDAAGGQGQARSSPAAARENDGPDGQGTPGRPVRPRERDDDDRSR